MNNVMLIGNFGGKPDFKEMKNDVKFCAASLAVNEYWRDAAGEKKERTDWIRVVAWGKTALRMKDYGKGDMVLVHGKIRERSWEDEKSKEKRRAHEVEVRVLQKIHRDLKKAEPEYQPDEIPPGADVPPVDDNIPF